MSTPLTNYSEQNIPDDGGDEDAWGPLVVGVHGIWDRALGGQHTVSTTGGTTALSTTEGQNGRIRVQGSLVNNATIQLPAKRRTYVVRNATTGNFKVTFEISGGSVTTEVPQGANMILFTDTTSTFAAGPVVNDSGGFPNTIWSHANGFDGPGIAFEGREVGFANRTSGVVGICLDEDDNGDLIRFQRANTNALPLLGLGLSGTDTFNTGLRLVDAGSGTHALALVVGGSKRGQLQNGLQLGSPTGGDKGADTINAAGKVYQNNVNVVAPTELAAQAVATSISVAHGLSAKPRYVDCLLRCTTTDNGYAVGDDVFLSAWTIGNNSEGYSVWANATYVGASITTFRVIPKSGGTPTSITDSSWEVVFRVAA